MPYSVNTAPILDAVHLVLSRNLHSIAATKLLLTLQQMQHQAGSPYVMDDAIRGHAIQKRLAAALASVPHPNWTPEEREIIDAALLAVEGQPVRDQRLQVRVTAAELQQIKATAKQAGQTLGAYVRAQLGLTTTTWEETGDATD